MATERYIQVGVTAMRDRATGEFLPAVPLYIKAEEGAEEAEAQVIHNISKLLTPRMKQYMDGRKAAGLEA